MTENKINPLLDAVSEIDDDIITNTNRPKKRLKKIYISAAVAAVSLMVITGAAAVYRNQVFLNNKKAIEYNFTVKENITFPTEELLYRDEQIRMLPDGIISYIYHYLNTAPSELFQMLNVSPLMSENFTEEKGDDVLRVDKISEDEILSITIGYTLFNKQVGKSANFVTTFKADERAEWSIKTFSKKHKVIKLNDGSKALIDYDDNPFNICWVTFSYDGIIYEMYVEQSNPDEIKQILSDLGIL